MGSDSKPGCGSVATPQLAPIRPEPGAFAGRVAVVTGGGWNLGRCLALELARIGAKVIVASRTRSKLETTVELARREDLPVRSYQADLSDPESVDALFADVAASEGKADILACFAGGYGCQTIVHETDPQDWFGIFRNNLFTTYLACRAALPGMLERGKGDILTVAGGGAFFPMVDVPATAYASAKAAVCRFTDQLYAEYMQKPGIRINCIEPGMTLNDEDIARIEEEEARTGQVHPLREHNHAPESTAELAMFLLSQGGQHLNGRIIAVDDDWWRDPNKVEYVAQTDLYRLRRTFLTD